MDELLEVRPDDGAALHASAEFAHDDGRHFDGMALLERVPESERTPAMLTLQNRLWIRLQVHRAVALARTDRFGEAREALTAPGMAAPSASTSHAAE